jgi:lysosomal alpha-mannosidase
VRDWRPTWRLNNTDPISSNFYPVTAAIEIAQPDKSALAVLTDRAQGDVRIGI